MRLRPNRTAHGCCLRSLFIRCESCVLGDTLAGGHPSLLHFWDSIPAAGAPSFRVLCERMGGTELSSRKTRCIGPKFLPLPGTQGWGTLSCGDSKRNKTGGPPGECRRRKRKVPFGELRAGSRLALCLARSFDRLRISPAGSRFAHARKAAQARHALARDDIGASDPGLKSGASTIGASTSNRRGELSCPACAVGPSKAQTADSLRG